MLNKNSAACQRRDQVDLGLVEQIVLPALKAGVGLLLDLENDVASEDARSLVTLATELDLGAALNATVDVDVQDLAVDNCLLAKALLAAVLVLDNLALAVAVWAHRLEALDHGTHLAHHRLHAVAVACCALPNGALLAATPIALGADDGALKRQLGDLAAVDVLEGDVVDVVDGLGLGRAALGTHAAEHATKVAAEAAAAAEELREQVLSRHAAAAASAALQSGLTILIVYLALLGVRQNLIGVRDLLELLLGSGVVVVLVCSHEGERLRR